MKSLFVLLAIAALFATGNALRCYTCHDCVHPFDPSGIKVMNSSTYMACVTEVFNAHGTTKFARYGINHISIERFSREIHTVTTSTEFRMCWSDYCNGAMPEPQCNGSRVGAYASLSTLFALVAIQTFSNWN